VNEELLDATLTDLQLATAHALAAEYGHEWALACPVATCPLTVRGIAAGVADYRDPGSMGGISAPTLDYYLAGEVVVTHRTATGQLTWFVFPDGGVRVEVERPDPQRADDDNDGFVVIVGTYVPGKLLQIYEVEAGGEREAPPVCLRHVRALRAALLTVVPAAELDRELFGVASRAQPDPPSAWGLGCRDREPSMVAGELVGAT